MLEADQFSDASLLKRRNGQKGTAAMKLPSALTFLIVALIALGFFISDAINIRGDLAEIKQRLTRERDAAIQQRDAALKERDAAIQERDAARLERDTARQERDAALQQSAARDATIGGLQQIVAGLNKRIAELQELTAAREPLPTLDLSFWPGLALLPASIAGTYYLTRLRVRTPARRIGSG
jgi:hypothetical protein